jgi:hypothetical protein
MKAQADPRSRTSLRSLVQRSEVASSREVGEAIVAMAWKRTRGAMFG